MLTRGIRGAITLNGNTKDDIKDGVVELCGKITELNEVKTEDIAFIIFTVTHDLNADFPAKYARLELGYDMVPMMCYREMFVEGALPLCLRALFVINTDKNQKDIKHCYLRGAKALRKDLEVE